MASQVQARTAALPIADGRDAPRTGSPFDKVSPPLPHAWSITVAMTNVGAEPVTVELRQRRADAVQITSEDQPHQLDRGSVKWRIPLAPHSVAQFRCVYSELSVYRARPLH